MSRAPPRTLHAVCRRRLPGPFRACEKGAIDGAGRLYTERTFSVAGRSLVPAAPDAGTGMRLRRRNHFKTHGGTMLAGRMKGADAMGSTTRWVEAIGGA